VTESSTGKPVANAKVFFPETTLYTTTNEQGQFQIKAFEESGHLVIYSPKYILTTAEYKSKTDSLTIKLDKPQNTLYKLEAQSTKKRQKDLKFFYTHFLAGYNNELEIQNDSVLFFIRNNKEFTAFTKGPLVIVNKHLGYIVHTVIERFYVYNATAINGKKVELKDKSGKLLFELQCFSYYEKLEEKNPAQQGIYAKNRKNRYQGSHMHFYSSLYRGNYEQEGFLIEAYPKNSIYSGIKTMKQTFSGKKVNNAKSYMIQGDSVVVNYIHHNNEIANLLDAPNDTTFTKSLRLYPKDGFFQLKASGAIYGKGFIINYGSASYFNSVLSLPKNYHPYRNSE
jgi:hypothetical protein